MILRTLFACVFLTFSAHSADHSTVKQDNSIATLVSEVDSIAAGKPFWLAFKIDPVEGSHSLWTNPGDGIAANKLTWKLPEGFEAQSPLYPTPKTITSGLNIHYGYDESAILLVRILVPNSLRSGSLDFDLKAEWQVCAETCVIESGEFELSLPVGDGAIASDDTEIFANARAVLPEINFWDSSLTLVTSGASLNVVMDMGQTDSIETAYFFPDHSGIAKYTSDQYFAKSPAGISLQFIRTQGVDTPASGNGILLLTSTDGSSTGYRLENVKVTDGIGSGEFGLLNATDVSMPVWQALLLAFLGGLILNLMPCVFPILSLKALALASSGGLSVYARRMEGLSYTLGVVISFAAIAAVLLFLRAGGEAIGWGFQLQSAGFVSFLAVIMLLVGLSLAGLFEISFGAESTGSQLASSGGNKGSFFTGVLATLVATPCTAPLMAPALGFALAQTTATALLIFVTLGFGMAAPFLLLAFSPKLGSLLPRPGAWMDKLKQGLSFPMFLTAAWLVYVVIQQDGGAAGFVLLGGLIIISFGVWLWQQSNGKILRSISLLIMLGTFVGLTYQPAPSESDLAIEEVIEGEIFSELKLAELRAANNRVFVYFTADWCITCKANEKIALQRRETVDFMLDNDIHILKGDWTNKNDEIAEVLARYGRAGVPLYLYFPKGAEKAVLLPELLTVDMLLDNLRSANDSEG